MHLPARPGDPGAKAVADINSERTSTQLSSLWDESPRFNPIATIVLTTLLALGGIALFVSTHSATDPAVCQYERPYDTVHSVFGRALDLDEALGSQALRLERTLFAVLGYVAGQAAPEALDAYSDLSTCAVFAGEPDVRRQIDAHVVLLLIETGRAEEAERAIDRFEAAYGAGVGVDALRMALHPDRPSPAGPPGAVVFGDADDWAADKLELRIGRASGEPDRVRVAQTRLHDRGKRRLKHLRALTFLMLLFTVPGFAAMVIWAVRRHMWPFDCGGMTVAPWSFGDGLAAMVRAGAVGVAALGFAAALYWIGAPRQLLHLGTLWWFLPGVLLVRVILLRPVGAGVIRAFGLDPPPRLLPGLLGFALGVTALALTGEIAFAHLLRLVGLEARWTDTIHEPLLHGAALDGALFVLDTVALAPIFEEIAFRGVLYATLRRYFSPLAAAVVSSLVFGAAHLYSVGGVVEVVWVGFVLALAYEHTRSLVPCIAAHAAVNAASVFWLLLIHG